MGHRFTQIFIRAIADLGKAQGNLGHLPPASLGHYAPLVLGIGQRAWSMGSRSKLKV
jgi:hypothetical protein